MFEFRTRTDKEFRSVHNAYFSDVINDYLDENDLRLYSSVVYVIPSTEKFCLVVRVWLEPGVVYTPLRLYFTRCGALMLFNFDRTNEEKEYSKKYEKIRI